MSETVEGIVATESTEIKNTSTFIRPLGDRIVVLEMDPPSATKSGIILPENTAEKTQRGVVIATGPGPRSPFTAQVADMGIAKGDYVMFSAMTGQELIVDGISLLVIREADVICVFETNEPFEAPGVSD